MALIGIARLASESDLLEAKSRVRYFEIPFRSILNRTKPHMPFRWTINPYRGCEFGCKYCYARYTHEYMEMPVEEFEEKIYAKAAAAPLLRAELARIPLKDHIALGTATDPYQPAERRFGRTRTILEVFARGRGRYLGITTKSDLVVRDLDLLREIARANVLSINITITTLNEKLARLLEPRAPRPDLRLQAVRKLSLAGLRVGVFPNPVMPLLTDSEAQLSALAKAARDSGAQYFGGGPLFLMPCAQKVFLPFLERQFPRLAPHYRAQFEKSPYLGAGYKERLRLRVAAIRDRFGLDSTPTEYRPELWQDEEQPSLFPLQ
ncbi:MAG: radical SAM protein [Acidobacteriia bacterium]|nr:radical SAM protein [Terriglobia bacterium]MBV8905240.1 radical SAM protein [Terriglobia bacterium]